MLQIVVLFIVLIVSCLVTHFKYICSRHSQGEITIDFTFLLCNYSFKWNQKFKNIFRYWVLLKFHLNIINTTWKFWEYTEHVSLENTLFPLNLNLNLIQLVNNTCLFQHHFYFKNIERVSSFVFGIITVLWNYVSKCKNIVI